MNDKYITVAEFSKRANISKQRVYQLLNKRLKEFVQEVDGKKMLDIRALESFSIQGTCSNNQDTCSSVVKEVCKLGGDVSTFVPAEIRDDIIARLSK